MTLTSERVGYLREALNQKPDGYLRFAYAADWDELRALLDTWEAHRTLREAAEATLSNPGPEQWDALRRALGGAGWV